MTGSKDQRPCPIVIYSFRDSVYFFYSLKVANKRSVPPYEKNELIINEKMKRELCLLFSSQDHKTIREQ